MPLPLSGHEAFMRFIGVGVVLSSLALLGFLLFREPSASSSAPHATSAVPSAAPQLRRSLRMALDSNMEMLSAYAELALQPEARATYWRNMGHIGQVHSEVTDYAMLASLPGVSVICEVGFNAGHSASVFLTANPDATLYTFDVNTLPYSAMSLALFRRAYPNRFHFITGASFDAVPWFKSQNHTCDLFSIDGDHSYEGAYTDLMNAIHTMRPGATIVADDVSSRSPGSLRAWHELVLAGYIRDEQCNDNGPEAEVANTQAGIKRWCWGTIGSVKGRLDATPLPHPPNTNAFASFSIDPPLPPPGSLH